MSNNDVIPYAAATFPASPHSKQPFVQTVCLIQLVADFRQSANIQFRPLFSSTLKNRDHRAHQTDISGRHGFVGPR